MFKKYFLCAFILFTFTNCPSPTFYKVTKDTPIAQLARIKPVPNLHIISINEEKMGNPNMYINSLWHADNWKPYTVLVQEDSSGFSFPSGCN